MALGIDPKVDYAFKKLFGSTNHKRLLVSLLNALLRWPVPIADIEILNPFSEKISPEDKLSILDVKATDSAGRLYLVEMQMLARADFPERCLYYWAKRYTEQMHQGEQYGTLRPAIMISFLDHTLFATPGHHTVFRLRAADPPDLLLSGQLEMHFVELPKFRATAGELRTPSDRWCYLMRHAADFDPAALPEPMKDETIREAVAVLEELSMTQTERWAYEDRIKGQRDQWAREKWEAMRATELAQLEASVAEKVTAAARFEASVAEKAAALARQEATVARQEATVAQKEATVAQKAAAAAQMEASVAQQLHLLNVREKRAALREAVLDKFQSLALMRRLTALEDPALIDRLTAKLSQSAADADFAAALDAEPHVPPG